MNQYDKHAKRITKVIDPNCVLSDLKAEVYKIIYF